MTKLFVMMNNAAAMHGRNHVSNFARTNAVRTNTKLNTNLARMGNLGVPMING